MKIINNPFELVKKQLSNMYFLSDLESEIIEKNKKDILIAIEYCFSLTKNKYYCIDREVVFDALHGGQYTIFLYMLSRHIKESKDLANKVYGLNRMLNNVDLFYEVELPRYFELDHPLGSVMGRAKYGEGFKFSQGCTVGNNKGIYPIIKDNVIMMSNSKIIGDCIVGENSIIAANTYIKDEVIPSDSIVFGMSPNLIIKKNNEKNSDS